MPPEKLPIYRHYKTGGLYRKLCEARLESTAEPMVVYVNAATGETWTRPQAEFEGTVTTNGKTQKRFTLVTLPDGSAPTPQ